MGLLIILIFGFLIYMYLNEGVIYLASKHFEVQITAEKIKEKLNKNKTVNKCSVCGKIIEEGKKTCEDCIIKESDIYNSTKTFRDTNDKNI